MPSKWTGRSKATTMSSGFAQHVIEEVRSRVGAENFARRRNRREHLSRLAPR
jgi:hypothetical protein